MKKATIKEVRTLIERLRDLAPHRPLTYGESLQVARVQASRLRAWVGGDDLAINLVWMANQRAVPVQFVPSHKLGEESGLTTNHIGGKLRVFINGSTDVSVGHAARLGSVGLTRPQVSMASAIMASGVWKP